MAKKPRWCAGPSWRFLGNCVWGGLLILVESFLGCACACVGAPLFCVRSRSDSRNVSWNDCVQPTIALSFSISQISRMWFLTA